MFKQFPHPILPHPTLEIFGHWIVSDVPCRQSQTPKPAALSLTAAVSVL